MHWGMVIATKIPTATTMTIQTMSPQIYETTEVQEGGAKAGNTSKTTKMLATTKTVPVPVAKQNTTKNARPAKRLEYPMTPKQRKIVTAVHSLGSSVVVTVVASTIIIYLLLRLVRLSFPLLK